MNLDEAECRAKVATPGPWRLGTYNVWADVRIVARTDTAAPGSRREFVRDEDDANADFIAHARTDVPALIAEVRRLREALAVYAERKHWDQWTPEDSEAVITWEPENAEISGQPWLIAQKALKGENDEP